jgi:cytochrome P450
MADSKSLLDSDVIQNPYPFYEELRRERPIAYMPELNGYFISNYALAKQVINDKRFQKMPAVKDGSKFVPASKAAIEVLRRDEEMGLPVHVISMSGGTRSTQLRKMTDPFFSRAAANAMEPAIQSCADLLLDRIEGDTCDLVTQFSSPFTLTIVCDVLGVPRSMLKEWKVYADAALAYSAFVVPDHEAVANAETMVAMHKVVREIIKDRRANPKNDLITAATQAVIDGAPLTEREIVYIVEELTIGGSETTSNAINCGMMHLATHLELQDAIRKDPQQTTAFMEEALRRVPSIQQGHRHAQEDIEVGGVLVKAGQKVYIGTASANCDESQFKCPMAFDHQRSDVRHHITFGGGQHFCLGQFLARIELRVAYGSWLKRFASFELTVPYESIRYHNTHVSRSPIAVPLRLKRGSA